MVVNVIIMVALSLPSTGCFDEDNRIRITPPRNPQHGHFHVANVPASRMSSPPSTIAASAHGNQYHGVLLAPSDKLMTYDVSPQLDAEDEDSKGALENRVQGYNDNTKTRMAKYKSSKVGGARRENDVLYSSGNAVVHTAGYLSHPDDQATAINLQRSMWIRPASNPRLPISQRPSVTSPAKLAQEDTGSHSSSPSSEGGTGHFHIPHFGIMEPGTYPRRSPVRSEHSVEGTFLWAVGLFGTVENGAILLTAIFSRKFKRPLHMLVGSLAATDLFISLVYIPSYTYFLLGGDQDFTVADAQTVSYTYCTISRGIFVEVASVTVTIKALIALYLYIFTISKESAKRIFATKNTLLYIFMAYVINFVVLFVPLLMGHSMVDLYPNALVCSAGPDAQYSMWENETAIALYSLAALGLHVVELIIICVCFVYLHRAIAQGSAYSDKHRENDKEARMNYRRASKLTLVVFVSFCVCWLPIYLVSILDPDRSLLPNQLHRFAMDLLLLKSSVNPTIYICAMRSLRHELRLLCICKCRSKSGDKIIRAAKAAIHRGSSSVTGSFDTSSAGV